MRETLHKSTFIVQLPGADRIPGMDVQIRPIQRQDASRLVPLLEQLGYPTTEADVHERLDYWADAPGSRLIGAVDKSAPEEGRGAAEEGRSAAEGGGGELI